MGGGLTRRMRISKITFIPPTSFYTKTAYKEAKKEMKGGDSTFSKEEERFNFTDLKEIIRKRKRIVIYSDSIYLKKIIFPFSQFWSSP